MLAIDLGIIFTGNEDTTEQIDRLTIQINELEVADTAFEKYARYGMSLLKDLTWYFKRPNRKLQENCLVRSSPQNWSFKMEIMEPAH